MSLAVSRSASNPLSGGIISVIRQKSRSNQGMGLTGMKSFDQVRNLNTFLFYFPFKNPFWVVQNRAAGEKSWRLDLVCRRESSQMSEISPPPTHTHYTTRRPDPIWYNSGYLQNQAPENKGASEMIPPDGYITISVFPEFRSDIPYRSASQTIRFLIVIRKVTCF